MSFPDLCPGRYNVCSVVGSGTVSGPVQHLFCGGSEPVSRPVQRLFCGGSGPVSRAGTTSVLWWVRDLCPGRYNICSVVGQDMCQGRYNVYSVVVQTCVRAGTTSVLWWFRTCVRPVQRLFCGSSGPVSGPVQTSVPWWFRTCVPAGTTSVLWWFRTCVPAGTTGRRSPLTSSTSTWRTSGSSAGYWMSPPELEPSANW